MDSRQDARVITQTLSWQQTTFTTTVTLGGPPTDGANPQANIYGSSSSKGLSTGEVGAIVGSVVGFFSILLLLCFCLAQRKRKARARRPRTYYYDSGSYYKGSIIDDMPPRPSRVRIQRPPPVAERIPGGPRWPTYRAIPIPNPRNHPQVPHVS